ncbi:3-hydroxyacyl-CoA dehydrogenase [Roseospira marina]|uniref:3-hydroxyacyl-CoA dehydrogenase n=1 Tax=Roseospira marina TaxID=140057 RepID=A0A5M6ICN2_9PROT|nr:3-hydroxyacyl-CoA dehydrogenase/enoyl-CoA hydratase family protein [Roseospira marina]KAA5606034.1 3-hydroxyacyl-CoA dehydrogenase [Roseospira marina]MBB4313105.1 3-hydroxyacyl-CoA dehydrogenase [Roseospira marina]MBB5086154.1 3-hydroxyacyl-CoA dehydrogenase [Roseospira marina]
MTDIKTVAVLGAGVMGAGIAAHAANAGARVLLLDIVPKGASSRNALAEGAVARMLKADPAPFMGKAAAKNITCGNLEDDLSALAEADWIIEAVIERPDIKRALYEKVEAVRKDGSVVSSNTSTLPLATLIEGLPERFARDFLIAHFFNPPRYMRLLELVTGPKTRSEAAASVEHFADHHLGKSVVHCKDTPSFIANRLGVFWSQSAVVEAFERGLDIEDVDAIIGRPMGVPKTGVFGLLDLVGLDLIPHVNASLADSLPKGDPFHTINRPVPLIGDLIADGYTGRKGKGGFYRLNRAGGSKVKEAIDLTSGLFRPARKADVPAVKESGKDLRALLSHDSPHGAYAWAVMGPTLAYAASLVGVVADDIVAIDEAMRLGYAWKQGPFELIDRIGADWLAERLAADGHPVPEILKTAAGRTFYRVDAGQLEYLGLDGAYHPVERPEGVLLLEDVKRAAKPVLRNGSAALWDIGDGVACFEFTSKMNSMDPDIMDLLGKAIRRVKRDFKALVIHNEGTNFSVGANLGLALFAANIAAWSEIESLVEQGQETYRALRTAPFPVVAAPSGMALGGGCEIVLHCDAVQAHAETYIGLVECGVGLVPAWGGCTEMLHRWSTLGRLPKGPMPAAATVFETISTATVAKSAAEAKERLFLRPHDGITMNRARLLADAKARALAMVEGYTPPGPREIVLPGPSGRTAMGMAVQGFRKTGKATPYDEIVAGALAAVLSGGDDADVLAPVGEDTLLELERTHFMRLVRTPGTLARVESMLMTGKPLRN